MSLKELPEKELPELAWANPDVKVGEIAAWILPCEGKCEHLSCELQREFEKDN